MKTFAKVRSRPVHGLAVVVSPTGVYDRLYAPVFDAIRGEPADIQMVAYTQICDALMQYIVRSLGWITSVLAEGFDYHGCSYFSIGVKEDIQTIFSSWLQIFSTAPDPVVFFPGYPHPEVYPKAEILSQLQGVLDLLELLTRDDQTLVYLGI